jgi:dienelactone hydrolase
MRLSFSSFLFLLFLSGTLSTQNADFYKVLGEKSDTLQNAYFLNQLQIQFDQRREQLKEACLSEAKLIKRRDEMRKWYSEKVGQLPPKTQLNPAFSDKVEMGTYTIQKVTFESKPNHHVTGLFYVPTVGQRPFPAVYIPCGHTKVAKANEDYQKAARLFAMNGFVVLQADPICQGERFQYLNETGKPVTREGTYMHEQLGHALLLTGKNTLIEELEDNIRCLDFLEQQPCVDRNKLAVAGHSGGGTQTTYLTAFDRRVKAATPVCYVATSENKLNTIGSQDGCQQLWGEGKARVEEQDFLFMAAPTPVRILATKEDFFSIKGARLAYNDLKAMYSVLNIPEKADMVSCPGEHGWHKPLREASMQWMKQWLQNDSSSVAEPDQIGYFEDINQVNVCPTGQVMTSYPGEKSVSDFTRERVKKCAQNRKEFLEKHSSAERIKMIKQLVGYEKPSGKVKVEYVGSVKYGTFNVEKLLIRRDDKTAFALPALLYTPEKKKDRYPATIIVSQYGKNDSLTQSVITDELQKGAMVLAVDVCNTGELKDNRKIDSNNCEFWIAKLPLFEGKTLLAYRAEDILLAGNYLKKLEAADPKNISLVSIGFTGPAALHAGVFDSLFKNIQVIGAITSWEDVANANHTKDQLGNVVPDALNYYDLPDLVRLMPQTSVRFVSPVNAEGKIKKILIISRFVASVDHKGCFELQKLENTRVIFGTLQPHEWWCTA